MSKNQKRLLNINEVSYLTGVAKGTLYNWVSQRKIDFVKINGQLRFDIEDINRMIEENKVPARES